MAHKKSPLPATGWQCSIWRPAPGLCWQECLAQGKGLLHHQRLSLVTQDSSPKHLYSWLAAQSVEGQVLCLPLSAFCNFVCTQVCCVKFEMQRLAFAHMYQPSAHNLENWSGDHPPSCRALIKVHRKTNPRIEEHKIAFMCVHGRRRCWTRCFGSREAICCFTALHACS